MNWETCNFEEESIDKIKLNPQPGFLDTPKLTEKNAEEKAIQLKRYLNPAKDLIRQSYLSLMSKYADLHLQNKTQEIADTMLAEDCKTFIFCSRSEITPVLYATEAKEFAKLYEHIKIKAIRVREVYADIEKQTGFQISNCEISYGNDDTVLNEVFINIFTFKDDRICKLRALFAHKNAHHGPEDYFAPSSKERMFAKVKEINIALAGNQPDLQKVSSIFNEKTVYRMWRWDDLKCFVFSKDDFSEKFKDLEEDYAITCIVPYEIRFDREFVAGTYGYHLEKKPTGQKYVWFSTCIYAFDEHINLLKVSQQGELYLEEDAVNPFEVYSKDKIEQNAKEMFENMQLNFDWFYKDLVQTTVSIFRLVPDTFPIVPSVHHGINHLEKFFNNVRPKEVNVEWIRLVDIFVDQQGPSYDTVFVMLCGQGSFFIENYKHKGKHINFFNLCRVEFENGKVIKILQCLFEVPEPILSPYDNPHFSGVTIKLVDPHKEAK